MMDNLLDCCLMARGFPGTENKDNAIYFNGLSWGNLFDGCLIQRERLRQGQTAAEGFPGPGIRELGMRTRFVFPLKEALEIKKTGRPGAQSQQESQQELQPESLAARVLVLLEFGSLSKSDLAAKLVQKSVSGQLNKVVSQLLQEKRIGYTIPEKPNSRLQGYRLTDKGRQMVRGVTEWESGE